MTFRRFIVIAIRADGSSLSSASLAAAEVSVVVAALLAVDPDGPKRVMVVADDGGQHADCGPIMTLDEAMRWRQPDDAVTGILRGAA